MSATMLALDLTGKLVVAVGGGSVSQGRVTDLVARGARVRVISPAVTDGLQEMSDAGTIEWLDRPYAGAPDLLDAWLVHTATGDGAVDGAVAADATTYRIWCVNASAVDEGTARTPARACVPTPDGPVEVAVTASGDPRRAAAVRQQIEASLRGGQMDLRRRRARAGAGWVALVGGGPGADGLLTVRGRQLLGCADVVVVDRLAPRGVLAELPEEVRVIDVGKDVGFHAVPQQRINEILVEEALAGHGVVRLKGGDPYVLGRGGEERLACEAAGVSVEVVAGVTSAISVPAAAGIPVTHRGLARSFTVVTGHDQVPSLPTGADHTLVVLMGVARLRDTAAAMIASGRSADCPAAVVERGLLPGQRTTVATLGELADRAAEVEARSPAVVVVGDVVTMAPEWSRHVVGPAVALVSGGRVIDRPLVLLAHGTRSAAGVAVVRDVAARVGEALGGVDVPVGFVDVCGPTAQEVLAGVCDAVVVPYFLTSGYHVHYDVPQAVAGAPGAVSAPALGRSPEVVDALVQRLAEAVGQGPEVDAILLGAAGSSDVRARQEVHCLAALLAAATGVRTTAGFLSGPGPTTYEGLQMLRRDGAQRVAAVALLLAPGVFHDKLSTVGAEVTTAPLGPHPALVDLVVRRYRDVLIPIC